MVCRVPLIPPVGRFRAGQLVALRAELHAGRHRPVRAAEPGVAAGAGGAAGDPGPAPRGLLPAARPAAEGVPAGGRHAAATARADGRRAGRLLPAAGHRGGRPPGGRVRSL